MRQTQKLHSSTSLAILVFETQIEVLIHTVHTISLPSTIWQW